MEGVFNTFHWVPPPLALRGLNENGFFSFLFLAKTKRKKKCRHTGRFSLLLIVLCGMLIDLMASFNFYLSWWVALHGSPRAIRMFTLDVPSNGKIERKKFRFGNNFFETHTLTHKNTTSKHLKRFWNSHTEPETIGVLISRLKNLVFVCLTRKQKLISSCAVDINPSNGFLNFKTTSFESPNSISQECCRTDTFFYKSLISQFWVDKVSVIRCFVLDGERHTLFVVSHENNRLTFTHTNKK